MSKMCIYAKIGVFCNLFTKNGILLQCVEGTRLLWCLEYCAVMFWIPTFVHNFRFSKIGQHFSRENSNSTIPSIWVFRLSRPLYFPNIWIIEQYLLICPSVCTFIHFYKVRENSNFLLTKFSKYITSGHNLVNIRILHFQFFFMFQNHQIEVSHIRMCTEIYNQ